jgi:hypothetical protein
MDSPKEDNPRALSPREREWLEWILPIDRPGYKLYRDFLNALTVIGEGRRGAGEFILGKVGTMPDFSAPLSAVHSYGLIETDRGSISVTLREIFEEQISVEIVCNTSDELPEQFTELRRWTYSTWKPGETCPQCVKDVREVEMQSADGKQFVLAICTGDRRIWFYEEESGVIHLIPVTNYYNELMLHKNIRDPKIALNAKLFFTDLANYTDADLRHAFATYNKLMPKVQLTQEIAEESRAPASLFTRFARLIKK